MLAGSRRKNAAVPFFHRHVERSSELFISALSAIVSFQNS
jgi:hypothetical protein